jgi:hypothetical protein
VQVPPNTVRDAGEQALVQTLATQVLDGLPAGLSGLQAKLAAVRQAVACLPISGSLRVAVYHTVQIALLDQVLAVAPCKGV